MDFNKLAAGFLAAGVVVVGGCAGHADLQQTECAVRRTGRGVRGARHLAPGPGRVNVAGEPTCPYAS